MNISDWRRERLARCGGLRGAGLEIGAGARPTVVDPDIEVRYLDIYSSEELRSRAIQGGNDPDAVVSVDYVVRGEDYRPQVDRGFDFIIANHVLEHIVDPVAWLQMLSELLNPDGHLLLVISDKKYSFNRFRDDTSIAQILADCFSTKPLADKGRIHALETHIYYDRGFINRTATPDEIFDPERIQREEYHPGVHCHVFQGETFLRRILKPLLFSKLIDFTLVDFVAQSPFGEFSVVLKKGWTPFPFELEDFYLSARAEEEETNRQLALIAEHKRLHELGPGVTIPPDPGVLPANTEGLPRQSMMAWRREVLARSGGLRGVGLEIGAATRPTVTDLDIDMKYLDFYSTEELMAHVAKNGGDAEAVVPVEYIARGEDYRDCVNRKFDFIIANHVFEHIVDVVAWLRMLSDLLNSGGHLLLTIPEKKRSFDHYRDDTSVAHILADYFSNEPLGDKAQVHAYETNLYYDRAYIKQTITAERLFAVDSIRAAKHHPGVHCHVFQAETFMQRIMKPLLFTRLIDYTLVDFVEKSPWGEFNVLLMKGWTPFAYTLEEFYQCSRATLESAQRRRAIVDEIEQKHGVRSR